MQKEIKKQGNPLPINKAISRIRSSPRIDRYIEMRKIYDYLYNNNAIIPEDYKFSVVNLSIDYTENKIKYEEIKDTCDILNKFMIDYSENII